MDELLEADVTIITETWLQDDHRINKFLDDFQDNTMYSLIRKDRGGGKRGGGLCIAFNREKIHFEKAKLPYSKHELLAAVGRRTGQRRKIVVLAIYVPPWYNAAANRSLCKVVDKALTLLRSRYVDLL